MIVNLCWWGTGMKSYVVNWPLDSRVDSDAFIKCAAMSSSWAITLSLYGNLRRSIRLNSIWTTAVHCCSTSLPANSALDRKVFTFFSYLNFFLNSSVLDLLRTQLSADCLSLSLMGEETTPVDDVKKKVDFGAVIKLQRSVKIQI